MIFTKIPLFSRTSIRFLHSQHQDVTQITGIRYHNLELFQGIFNKMLLTNCLAFFTLLCTFINVVTSSETIYDKVNENTYRQRDGKGNLQYVNV